MPTSVQIKVDLGGKINNLFPHTFLSITHPDGTVIEYGFTPQEKGSYGKGHVEITGSNTKEGPHVAHISGEVHTLTSGQYNRLMGIINGEIDKEKNGEILNYFVGGDSIIEGERAVNCTVWANEVLKTAGLSGLDGLMVKLSSSPYGQAIFFKVNQAMEAFRALFNTAKNTPTPLILDLDGDGVETRGVTDGAWFDHGGDGFAEQTGWVGPDDGLLAWDRNGNGRIDSGAELFGDNSLLADCSKAANGFEALAALDDNLDGRIDSQDATGVLSVKTGYTESDLPNLKGLGHAYNLYQAMVRDNGCNNHRLGRRVRAGRTILSGSMLAALNAANCVPVGTQTLRRS